MKIEMKAGGKTCLSFYGPICEGWSEKDKCFDESILKPLGYDFSEWINKIKEL